MDSRNSRLLSLEKIILKLNQRINYLTRKSNKFSFYRLMTFLTGLLLTIGGFFINNILGWAITIISISVFGIIVHFHNKLIFGMKRCNEYLKLKEKHLARMNLDWENISQPIVNNPAVDQTIEKDLDLVGDRSLHHLMDLSVSYEGSLLLKKWISKTSPDLEIILERQKIIKELFILERFRDKFLLKSHMISKKFLNGEKIINWLRNLENQDLPSWLLPISFLLIIIYITLFILYAIGFITYLWLIPFLFYFFIYSSNQKTISKIIESSIGFENHFKKFASLIIFVDDFSFQNYPYLKRFLSSFTIRHESASVKLKHLQKIITALLIRENPIIRLIVNIIFPYDIFFCRKLVKLNSEVKDYIPKWLETLNKLECLISIANFYYLNPDYVFPEIILKSKNEFKVDALGHPLIKHEKKVTNDISFNKDNEIMIITGSNMSGKSTFLKTIGINLCLANAGAPVNANNFKISLYELFTCIKVNDSVTDGISYFYAEVKRLKELLDKFQNENNLTIFFLIDEIFKGTNNKERLIGSRAFIKKLSHLNSTGAISTHDLELVNIANEIDSIDNYHFREEIMNGTMHFDYKIHKGPCPTTNALKIMEMVGLPVQ